MSDDLTNNWPAPPHPDDLRADAVDEPSLRSAPDDAATLLKIVKLFDAMAPYAQRAALDWLQAYYDEVTP